MLKALFQDENLKISSTRVVLIVALLIFIFCFLINMVMGIKIDEQIYEIIKVCLGGGMGANGVRTGVKNWKAH